MTTEVRVISVRYDGGTIATGTGVHEYDGGSEIIHFAADWRPMRDIADALNEGEEIIVNVEDWQILGVEREAS